ncbi:MAG: TatD family hydrolase [Lachnospiraceae bacterium]|nr:TatD family hydrolase [Lachnospiraceae bacterium]
MRVSFVDTHTHYAHKRFDSGRDEIVNSLVDVDVLAVIEAAIDFESNLKMKFICEKYSHVYMAVGCHPNCVGEMDDYKYQKIVELMGYSKVIAIGETGLDYAKNKSEQHIQIQKKWFERFVLLAINTNKPLIIHARESYDELIKILQGYELSECPGVIHCFSGNEKQAIELIEMGFYIGVNGMFTNMDMDSDVCQALKIIPLERVLLETDSPYLLPKGAKGKRNTSANLKFIVDKLAELRGESSENISRVVLENTKRVFTKIGL